MNSKRIHYTSILEEASENQLLALCKPDLRELLSVDSAGSEQHEEKTWRKLLIDAVDIRSASRDGKAREIIFDLIRSCLKDYVLNLARYAEISSTDENTVLDFFRSCPEKLVSFLNWNRKENIDEESETLSGEKSPKRKLRYYQLVGVRTVWDMLENKKRCLYQAPTGAGKTRTAMTIVSRHFLMYGPTKVLWLASNVELVTQACRAFTEEWEFNGDTSAVLYEWRGGEASFNPDFSADKNTMLIASVQLLSERKKEISKLKGEISLVVFDEAHQSVAATYKEILQTLLKGDSCKLLGLSATPIRSGGPQDTQELQELYGNNKIKIHSGRQNPIEFLIEKGYLAKPCFHTFSYHLKNFSAPETDAQDYGSNVLEQLGQDKNRNAAIASNVKKIIDEGRKRILVFTPNVLSAQHCTLLLRHLYGVQYSYCITGKMDKTQRKRNLSNFTGPREEPVVIFNCQVLTTGFDEPKTDAVVIARPTKSATLYAQMIGRALRGPESSGTEEAYIYNFADQQLTDYNDIVKLFENFEQTWNNKS